VTTKTALFSDVHGNSPALRSVLADIEQAGCGRVFMLGDLINGIDPHGCVTALRAWAARTGVELACLKGNGEEYLLTPEREALPQQDEAMNRDMILLAQWWQDHLSAEDLAWVRQFKDYVLWDDACLAHDRPQDRMYPDRWHTPGIDPKYQEWFYHSGGVMDEMPDEQWQALWAFMDEHQLRRVFVGHTHRAFQRKQDGKLVCNLGSAGASTDGDPRAVWALVAPQAAGGTDVSWQRVAYDVAETHRLIDQTPDYQGFADARYRQAYKQWFATGVHWKAHYGAAQPARR
jgi:predicted phosphodiesterase